MVQCAIPPSPPMTPVLAAAKDKTSTITNRVIFEAFEWHCPADHKHWRRLLQAIPSLASIGITDLWLPPGSKGKDAQSNGYDIYDAYDLGEFDQKGTIPTKWGTKGDLMSLATDCKDHSIGLIWDAILNHRAFADSTETVKVVEVDPRDRRIEISPPFDIVAWTKFDFSARKGKYSSFTYAKNHFNGTDWDQTTQRRAIYRFAEDGKDWMQDVGKMQGNADYLMLENLDYTNPELCEETINWGQWIMQELGLSGFRLDAVPHYSWKFADMWSQHLNEVKGGSLLCMGEFWHGDVRVLLDWLDNMSPGFHLYDVPLMYKIKRLSWNEDTDLRHVFRDTLVEARPNHAVTFINVHDTQKGQEMDTPIRYGFTPHAYSLLLLRRDGLPCVFFGDLYGTTGPHPEPPTCWGKLSLIILAQRLYAYGPQIDYFERSDCIGWVRSGTEENPDGCAVILSWSQPFQSEYRSPSLFMYVGKSHAGEAWTDVLGFDHTAVEINEDGFGLFPCQQNSMACFVSNKAAGRERFHTSFDPNFYHLGNEPSV